jgi:hypothetical protein
MSKRATLLFIAILAVSSLILVESAFAQSITKPSVPEFTLKLADHSYDVPATYSIDPHTGQNITHPGYHVENKTVDITIKNQPFVSSINGTTYQLYYNVRHKGSFEDTWTELSWTEYTSGTLVPQSNSQYTVISYSTQSYPINASLDFQIQALMGCYYQRTPQDPFLPTVTYFGVPAAGESKWSSIQTIIISASTPSTPLPTTTPSPTNYTGVHLTEQEVIIIVAIVAAVIGAGLGLLIYLTKRK